MTTGWPMQDAQVVFTVGQAKATKAAYEAEGYVAKYKKVGWGH